MPFHFAKALASCLCLPGSLPIGLSRSACHGMGAPSRTLQSRRIRLGRNREGRWPCLLRYASVAVREMYEDDPECECASAFQIDASEAEFKCEPSGCSLARGYRNREYLPKSLGHDTRISILLITFNCHPFPPSSSTPNLFDIHTVAATFAQ